MDIEGFNTEDKGGMGTGNIPYYGIKLTKEQAKLIEHKKLDFYTVDGRTIFEVKDKNGNNDGYILFVIFPNK